MEQALLANSMVLDQLKHGFMSNQKIEVFFDVDIQVGNVSNVSCLSPWSPNAFCRSNSLDHDWNLCSPHSIVYRYQYDPVIASIPWLAYLHGRLLLLFAGGVTTLEDLPVGGEISLTLEIEELLCHPPEFFIKCASSELFSWVR